jgi:predicted N-acetyltransferase YhbS
MDVTPLIMDVFPDSYQNAPDFDHSVSLTIGDKAIAHVGMTFQFIEVREGTFKIAAIGYVATAEHWRHRGLMDSLMEVAKEQARRAGCDWALLATDIKGLYEPLGFHHYRNLNATSLACCLGGRNWPADPIKIVDKGAWTNWNEPA